MISLEFKLSEFINAVQDRDKHIVINLAESEAQIAEKISELKGYGQDYVDTLIGFCYFLRYQQKPYGINEKHFQMFKPVCEKLVEKKQLSSDILKLFNSVK